MSTLLPTTACVKGPPTAPAIGNVNPSATGAESASSRLASTTGSPAAGRHCAAVGTDRTRLTTTIERYDMATARCERTSASGRLPVHRHGSVLRQPATRSSRRRHRGPSVDRTNQQQHPTTAPTPAVARLRVRMRPDMRVVATPSRPVTKAS